jgi:tRNA-dihydrouridine synthase 4
MAARGMLENPALYAGFDGTPWGCVERYVNYALSYGSNSHIFQHHLAEMTGQIFTKKEHRQLNELKSIVEIVDWLDERFILKRKGEENFGKAVSAERRSG